MKDVSWNILVDLYHRHLAGVDTTITSVCVGSHFPQTTALRHAQALEQEGLIESYRGHGDGRLRMVRLTAEGIGLMDQVFALG
jgi:DNA-binding MarR family transcriptional regulator